jgi:choice-of-anchor A domain-containing protein
MMIGRNWIMNADAVVMQNSPDISGNIIYKGESKGSATNFWTNGSVERDPNLDLTFYEKALDELKVKSAYWASLNMNGIYVPYDQGPNKNTAVFKAGDDDCLQVFELSSHEFDSVPWGIHIKFDDSLKGKTILINYGSDHHGLVEIKNLANFFDPWGNGGWDFNTTTTASILWNFHDAAQVNLGAGSDGVGEFIGSILIPNGR